MTRNKNPSVNKVKSRADLRAVVKDSPVVELGKVISWKGVEYKVTSNKPLKKPVKGFKATRIVAKPLYWGAVVLCKNCEDVVQSQHRHDFATCSCGNIAVDGGSDYCRMVGGGEYTIVDEGRYKS